MQDRLSALAAAEVAGTQVLTARPDNNSQPESGPTIHVFLYDVLANPYVRNEQLPTRDQNGVVVDEPQVALDLRYLLTFSGRDPAQESQRLLGATITNFSLQPTLTPAEIQRSTDARGHLSGSDLHEQAQPVILTPLHLDLEELSRLWSVLLHEQPYELSMQYQASAVIVSPDTEVRPPPDAEQANITTMSFDDFDEAGEPQRDGRPAVGTSMTVPFGPDAPI